MARGEASGADRRGRSSGQGRRQVRTCAVANREYRKWNALWIALLLAAFAIGILTLFFRASIPDGLFTLLIVVANVFVAAAIVINATKMRTVREGCRRQEASQSKSKAARAEQKRQRALERERARGQEPAPAQDEASMTFRERLAYRAQKSAEAANVKGSGL